jgi:CheY-like chemotaxis protein
MPTKRALVVDDSASARVFLSRILERYGLEVDSADSAEKAIEYLGHERPDVIFMDHQMPGMDGFQAVEAIKSNPRTALIPILMYTSREGELYMSQARALGAVGVLPKQTTISDVSRVLEQLHLVPVGRAEASPPLPTERAPVARADDTPSDVRIYALVEPLLDGQLSEVRRLIHDRLEQQTVRIADEVRQTIVNTRRPPSVWRRAVGWLTVLATGLSIVLAFLWNTALQEARALDQLLAETRQQLAVSQQHLTEDEMQIAANQSQMANTLGSLQALATQNAPVSRSAPAEPTATPPATGGMEKTAVPFAELPFSLGRVEWVRAQVERLLAQGFRGTVQVVSYPGRFCLLGGEEPALAPPADAYSHCGAVGNPIDAVPANERQSAPFADMITDMRRRGGNTLTLQVAEGDAEETIVDYPPPGERLSAGEWNRAAAANNRVEVRWRPQPRG